MSVPRFASRFAKHDASMRWPSRVSRENIFNDRSSAIARIRTVCTLRFSALVILWRGSSLFSGGPLFPFGRVETFKLHGVFFMTGYWNTVGKAERIRQVLSPVNAARRKRLFGKRRRRRRTTRPKGLTVDPTRRSRWKLASQRQEPTVFAKHCLVPLLRICRCWEFWIFLVFLFGMFVADITDIR